MNDKNDRQGHERLMLRASTLNILQYYQIYKMHLQALQLYLNSSVKSRKQPVQLPIAGFRSSSHSYFCRMIVVMTVSKGDRETALDCRAQFSKMNLLPDTYEESWISFSLVACFSCSSSHQSQRVYGCQHLDQEVATKVVLHSLGT
jgi:hypothetical protein